MVSPQAGAVVAGAVLKPDGPVAVFGADLDLVTDLLQDAAEVAELYAPVVEKAFICLVVPKDFLEFGIGDGALVLSIKDQQA